MWEGVWVSACVCAICFCLSFLCLLLCQSRNFTAGDYQRWFWVQSWIISFCVWYKHLGTWVCAHVWVCFMCFFLIPKNILSGMCVLIPVYQWTWIAHFETELSVFLHVGQKAVCSDPTPQMFELIQRLAKCCYLLYCDGDYYQILSQTFWITLDNEEIGLNNSKWVWLQHYIEPSFIWNLPCSGESNYLLRWSRGTFVPTCD